MRGQPVHSWTSVTLRAAMDDPARDISAAALTQVVQRTCTTCHNPQLLTGHLSLVDFDVAAAVAKAATAERMIVKLRAGMMPPPGAPRPGGDTLLALVQTLERVIDDAAAAAPNPGGRTFQRLNRVEYASSIRELLGLDIDAGEYLPLDTKSANFDNIADVQLLSPMVLDAYLRAASEISRLATGDPNAGPREATYSVSPLISQRDQIEGAPFGTRGGTSVVHTFPADGEYVFKTNLQYEEAGQLFGNGRGALHTAESPEQLEISVNGERAALLEIARWADRSVISTIEMRSPPIFVRAGPQRVTAAFVRKFEGPVEDVLSSHDWSYADNRIGMSYGITSLPHLSELVIGGPQAVTGISDTPSRHKIFGCRPTTPAEEMPCAREIISNLAARAYRRPIVNRDLDALLPLYDAGRADGGFEAGIRTALEAILASPSFVFRFEEVPAGAEPGENYRIADVALATRLSFFLWGTPPDEELIELAARGKLGEPSVLSSQTKRMLADPRAEALATRFAAQWLRLQDLEKIHPDASMFPDFDQQLAASMVRETELFFYNLLREDRSVLDLFTADYTFVNDRLAKHYGIQNVTGTHFRRVRYPDDRRGGLLGHGSILTLTSHANRTSPVLRGKWVMEVLLGTPPPPPPPGVPDLEQTKGSKDGRLLTTRERMEMHRASPVCRSCHMFMDPVGLTLDNFDVTGRWRIRENGMPLDTRGQMYDGTAVQNPADLRAALLKRPVPLIRTFTENLMAYALGRRIEYYDKPLVRSIASEAEADGYRLSSFVTAVVNSDAFRMGRAEAVAKQTEQSLQR
ncbi:MAG: DUF1592 domain-containing protein, partial [Gemmatimonadetes bacterium]|nr:DUF1592 domain-containing protein [Gemmatimonadota bacterium]